MPRFDPTTYPGTPVGEPTLVFRGRSWPLGLGRHRDEPVVGPDAVAGAQVLTGPWRWSLAYGSNASPDRLIDKGLDTAGAILIPAAVLGWQRAWEARRTTSTGAVPLTLQPAPGARLDVPVLGLLPDDAEILDASEGRGPNYTLGRIGPVAVGARFHLEDALAYGPTGDTRVLLEHGRIASYPAVAQSRASELFDRPEPPSVAAEPLGQAGDGWPSTPLDDLPLFVYGSLQPGHRRWEAIAPHVEVVGDAEAQGTLTATVFGWPAADFTGGDVIQGTLLQPHSADTAAALYEETDRIEDVPSLFRRVAVPVLVQHGRVWAATYEWNREQGAPPGTVLQDGRWIP
ncbi:MAG: gamma-glutamylcyclotransferase family protein [Nitriliruptorales bacterium]|nr:gamma-glutamylcyclotransferase family protein [Nitriliruptorales bacterium]